MAIETINPATGERIQTHEEMSRTAVDEAIGQAHDAFLAWRHTPFEEHARCTRAAAQILLTQAETFAPRFCCRHANGS